MMQRIEVVLGRGTSKALPFAGEDVARLHLIGPKCDFSAHGALLEAFLVESVVEKQTEWPDVIVALRLKTRSVTCGRHARSEREEAILTEGLERRQSFSIRSSTRRPKSEPEPLEQAVLVGPEGGEEQPRCIIAMIAHSRVGADRAVGHTIKDADLIGKPPLKEVSPDLIADIALRNQQGR